MKTFISDAMANELIKELEEPHTMNLPIAKKGDVTPKIYKAIWLEDVVDIIKKHQKIKNKRK